MSQAVGIDRLSLDRGDACVLRDATLSIDHGESVAVVGRTGSGKSSLLLALLGLIPIVSGRICLLGEVCEREKDFVRARRSVGLLFQDSDDQLFCPTVALDVAFGPMNQGLNAEQVQQRVTEAMTMLELTALADRSTQALSGGQKRLVALAGLLAMRPQVMLLDEPTAGLDEYEVDRLCNALSPLEMTLLIVSHDRAFCRRWTDRAWSLDNGRVADRPLSEVAII